MMKTVFAVLAVLSFLWATPAHTAESDTVAGKWHFVLNTAGGDRESDSIFEQKAEKVTGHWAVTSDNKGDTVTGTYSDKKLTLEFTLNSPEIGPGTMKVTGLMKDDGTLSGDWAFQDYSGTFSATKMKDEPQK